MTNVLLTGAAGRMGPAIRDGLRGRYSMLRVSHHRLDRLGEAVAGEELNQADLCSLDDMEAAMDGIDVVIHMGGRGTEGEWEGIHEKNIVGTYNVFEAARRQKVSRVIYASSHHAVGFHRRSKTLDLDVEPRPDGPYGVSKVFGEALGRMYADKHGMSVVSLRIGAFRQKPEDIRQLSVWLSPKDCIQLLERCIEATDIHYAVIYGISNNTRAIWDNSDAALIGYKPKDNAEDYLEEVLRDGKPEGEIATLFHGGHFCQMDFDGDPSRID